MKAKIKEIKKSEEWINIKPKLVIRKNHYIKKENLIC